jgi:hypothetical protein
MRDVELNPVGAVVLNSSGGVPLLVGLKTGGIGLALLFSVALWQREQLRSKVLISSYTVAMLGVAMMCFMAVDVVGMQTQRWAREMKANAIAHSRGEPLPYPPPPAAAPKHSFIAPISHSINQTREPVVASHTAELTIHAPASTHVLHDTHLLASSESNERRKGTATDQSDSESAIAPRSDSIPL